MYDNPWVYRGDVFDSEHIPDGAFGFVYLITNTVSGRRYIGRKYFYSLRKVKGKKKRVRKESDWKKYYGSSKLLKEDVLQLGTHSFTREILSIHNSRGQVNYNEAKQQFVREVLESTLPSGERAYYNDNIMSRYFAKDNNAGIEDRSKDSE